MTTPNPVRRIALVWTSVACSCAAGPSPRPQDAAGFGVQIAVPAREAAASTLVWFGKEVAVDFLPGPLEIEAEAHQLLFTDVWGVTWNLGKEDLARLRSAVQAHGEACLVFERRPFAWCWAAGDVSPRGTFLNWPSLSEQDAIQLAVRVSASGR